MRVRSHLLPLVIVALVIVLDQVTKWWVMTSFALYESRVVVDHLFSLTYITNTGAAFGFLAGEHGLLRQVFFLGVGSVALVVLGVLYRHEKERRLPFVAGLALVAGGAIGNMIDRLRFGSVVDFLDFYIRNHHWPAFNVADSAITVGVAFLLIDNLILNKEKNTD